MNTKNVIAPPHWQQRMVLAIRRIIWLIGALPVLLLAFVIGFGGATFSMLWMGVCWLAGSREMNNDPMMWTMEAAEWVWKTWQRLIGQNGAGELRLPDHDSKNERKH